ncbi:MAG: TerC family protein [Pseudomonadota bacterium]|nr:TerC family protein [Pseudomonadota bacterium]
MIWIENPASWLALFTLTLLEIVLGIDNIIFITILVGRLPLNQRDKARKIGLGVALITRLALLFVLSMFMRLTFPLWVVAGYAITGRNIILMVGGLFLLAKATQEIHSNLEGEENYGNLSSRSSINNVIVQIALLDIVFSLDSVITAFGLVDEIAIMACAIILAVLVMLRASKPIGEFVDRHPTIRMLALAFLIMIGLTLITEAVGIHVPKGYIYFAMFFSLSVEMLNIRLRHRREKPVRLRKRIKY